MAKSDARFGYQAKLGRQDHDLSQPYGFTCAPGMLLPIWYDFASPGDSFYMQHDLPLLRSTVLQSPAMVDVKIHYETFFVPMQMIYQPFENVYYQLSNIQSNNFQKSSLRNSAFPLLNISQLIELVTSSDYYSANYRADAFRLWDLLGLCPDNFLTNLTSAADNANKMFHYEANFFPWQLAAYHCIFEYYYRLDDKSVFDHDVANLDKYYNEAVFNPSAKFCRIHQRPWDFDYFTSMYRSPIVSEANMQSLLGESRPDVKGIFGSIGVLGNTQMVDGGISINGTADENQNSSVYGTSIQAEGLTPNSLRVSSMTAQLRSIFAREKLAMITGRTRKNYDSQVLAHLGINVPHDVKHDIIMIHHDEYDLNVQEVTSLASTDDSPLGELAGKSYGTGNGKQFKFSAPCHGVVMTIFSVEPKRRYHTTFDRLNAVQNAFDFPVPEYDRLGNVPMYRYEIGMPYNTTGITNNDLIGWKERYYQFKRKPAKTSYAFSAPLSTAYTVNNWSSFFISTVPFADRYGNTVPGLPDSTPEPQLEEVFYISRNILDPLCIVSYYDGWFEDSDGENWSKTPWMAYYRDPFIVNSHIKCKKVSWMSKDGEPVYPM